MKHVLLLLVTCAVLAAAVAAREAWSWWHAPIEAPGGVIVVDSGGTLSAVARELATRSALTRPRLWTWVARYRGLDGKIKRGEYGLDHPRSPKQMLDMLVTGSVITYSVTLPEGITLAEGLALLQSQEAVTGLLDGTGDPRLLALVEPHTHPEGLFFPDTYVYRRGDTDLDILTLAHRRMSSELSAAWAGRDGGLPYGEPYEALIMASIVEKETGVPEERDRIAGVFVRRLEQRMRLQTDPTIIYGLGEDYRGNITRRHLADAGNLYNTYRHAGLPPTPIALPGRAALLAAVRPAEGRELYFVARGDGSHEFSETIEQHTRAVRRFQLSRREDYRSSPPPGESQ
jgi:UPF0755 protein